MARSFKCYIFYIYISVQFRGRVFQQMISIPMDTNCAPLLAYA